MIIRLLRTYKDRKHQNFFDLVCRVTSEEKRTLHKCPNVEHIYKDCVPRIQAQETRGFLAFWEFVPLDGIWIVNASTFFPAKLYQIVTNTSRDRSQTLRDTWRREGRYDSTEDGVQVEEEDELASKLRRDLRKKYRQT